MNKDILNSHLDEIIPIWYFFCHQHNNHPENSTFKQQCPARFLRIKNWMI